LLKFVRALDPTMSNGAADSQPTPSEGDNPLQKPLVLRLADGSTVDIATLEIPASAKKLLEESDLDGTGEVDEQNISDALDMIVNLKKAMQFGIDHDKGERLSSQQIHAGVETLMHLMRQKAENSETLHYRHMPACVQAIMKTWDLDGDKTVNVVELAAAAEAFKKQKQEGRIMKKIIVGMSIVILILMSATFILSYLAAEAAKEVRASSDGTMSTATGSVMRSASSEFQMLADGSLVARGPAEGLNCTGDGTTCRRLSPGQATTLKVAASEEKNALASTLPDDIFHELKSLQMNLLSKVLEVKIAGFQRVPVRSSKCGSVVHLQTPYGRLTLDDLTLSADAVFVKYLQEIGLEDAFDIVGIGFGRRLKIAEGSLGGFFNILKSAEYECQSQPLEPPEELERGFIAETQVKELLAPQERGLSFLFKDDVGNPLPKPGVVKEDGKLYSMVQRDVVQAEGLTAERSTFGMFPMLKELIITHGDAQLRMVVEGATGHRCELIDIEEISKSDRAGQAERLDGEPEPRLEFLGIKEEGSLILRRFKLHIKEIVKERRRRLRRRMQEVSNGTEVPNRYLQEQQDVQAVENVMSSGLGPTYQEYWDVDSDATGKRNPGDPYRIILGNEDQSATMYTETTYRTLQPLPDTMSPIDVFRLYDINQLSGECVTRTNGVPTDGLKALLEATKSLTSVADRRLDGSEEHTPGNESFNFADTDRRLATDDGVELNASEEDSQPAIVPDLILPFDESISFLYSLDQIIDAVYAETKDSLTDAMAAGLKLARTFEAWMMVLTDAEGLEDVRDVIVKDIQGRKRWAEEDEVDDDEEDTAGSRRLAESNMSRRLNSLQWWDFATSRQFDLNIDLASAVEITVKASFEKGTNELIMVAGGGKGCVPIFWPPKVQICAGGYIEYYPSEKSLGGSILVEAVIGPPFAETVVGLEIGGKLSFNPVKLVNIWGKVYVEFRMTKRLKFYIEALATFEPAGTGGDYYKKWTVSLALTAGISAKRWASTKTIDIGSFTLPPTPPPSRRRAPPAPRRRRCKMFNRRRGCRRRR